MADTQLTTTAALAALADNTDGDISPQDIRNQFTTLRNGMGQMYVPAAASAAVTIANTSDYVEVTAPAWTLSAGDYISLWVRNSTSTGDPTIEACNLQAVTSTV